MNIKKQYKRVNIESDGDTLKNENETRYIKVNLFCLVCTALICGILLFIGFIGGIYVSNYFNINNNDNNIDNIMSNDDNKSPLHASANAAKKRSLCPNGHTYCDYGGSDYRLKYDIKLLSDNINPYKSIGLNYYTWKWKNIIPNNAYIGDNGYINNDAFGVIAQEVSLLYPDAVKRMNDGYLAVYYSLLDEYTKNMQKNIKYKK